MNSIQGRNAVGCSRRTFFMCGVAGASFLVTGGCSNTDSNKDVGTESDKKGASTVTGQNATDPSVFGDPLEQSLAALAVGLLGTQSLGKRYLSSSLGQLEDRVEDLLAALVKSLDGFSLNADTKLEQYLSGIISADFKNDRVLYLDGWHVSVTECRLAGLSVLLGGAKAKTASGDSLASMPLGEVTAIANWGPKTVVVGVADHIKKHGHFAMWFKIPGVSRNLKVYVGGHPVKETYGQDLMTTAVEGPVLDRLFSAPATHDVVVVDVAKGIKQYLGTLEVR